jgi:4-hydroxybenzoyl-CoA thioesterase
MQEARVEFYRTLGFKNELNFEGDVGQVIADVAVEYKSESFLADRWIIKLGVSDFSKYGFDMFYLVENKVTGKEVARGKTGIVCFDYSTRKVARIPAVLLKGLS